MMYSQPTFVCIYVYVIAWFGVKFGINHTSNVPRMGLNYTLTLRLLILPEKQPYIATGDLITVCRHF